MISSINCCYSIVVRLYGCIKNKFHGHVIFEKFFSDFLVIFLWNKTWMHTYVHLHMLYHFTPPCAVEILLVQFDLHKVFYLLNHKFSILAIFSPLWNKPAQKKTLSSVFIVVPFKSRSYNSKYGVFSLIQVKMMFTSFVPPAQNNAHFFCAFNFCSQYFWLLNYMKDMKWNWVLRRNTDH